MITSSEMYWITRLDGLNSLLSGIGICCGVFGIAFLLDQEE